MKKLIVIFLIGLMLVSQAFAGTKDDLVGLGMKPELASYVAGLSTVMSNAEWIQATDVAGTGTLNLLRADATDDTVLNADSGDLVKISVAKTPVAAIGAPTPAAAFTPQASADFILNGKLVAADDEIFASGKGEVYGIAITTPSTDFTPVSASSISARVSRLVAGSPTLAAVHLPAATASVGKRYEVANEGSYPVVIAPINGADTINALAAKTPFSIAAGKIGDCLGVATGKYQCGAK